MYVWIVEYHGHFDYVCSTEQKAKVYCAMSNKKELCHKNNPAFRYKKVKLNTPLSLLGEYE